MSSIFRRLSVTAFLGAAVLLVAAPAAAQFGIGGRMAWVTNDSDLDDVDSVRFTGGQIRLGLTPRLGVELSMDRHKQSFELLNEEVTLTPIQASLLMRLAGGSFSPYLLGGPGWYRRSVELIDDSDVRVSSSEFGWHAGIGLEIRMGRHAGLHGDYRYTFLDFGEDDDDDEGIIGRFIPGHRGSMWTLGFTVYF